MEVQAWVSGHSLALMQSTQSCLALSLILGKVTATACVAPICTETLGTVEL